MTDQPPPLPTDDDQQGRSVTVPGTPVLVAAAIVALAVLVGAFLLGRATAPDATAASGGRGGNTQTTEPVANDPLTRALELHNAGNLAEAELLYQQVLDDDDANQYALYNLGQIAQTRGDLEIAIVYYDRALAVDPQMQSAAYNRAIALRDVGRVEDSIAAFESLLVANPDSVGILFNLGNLLISQGDVERGTELVNRAVELEPSLRGN